MGGGGGSVNTGGGYGGGSAGTGVFSVLTPQGGTTADLRNYHSALAYLSRDPWMRDIIARLHGSRTQYTVRFKSGTTLVDGFNDSTNSVNWDPTGSLWVGGCLSPALALGHELAHADGYNYSAIRWWLKILTPDNQYDNAEEKRVITGPEASAAATLGEPRRYSHSVSKGDDRVESKSTSRSCNPRKMF